MDVSGRQVRDVSRVQWKGQGERYKPGTQERLEGFTDFKGRREPVHLAETEGFGSSGVNPVR